MTAMTAEELRNAATAGGKLLEYGVLGAVLLLLLLFMGILTFRYWLPMTHRLQLEREKLQAELTKAREEAHSNHVGQLTSLLEQRDKVAHEREQAQRQEHGRNWERQREWQAEEAQKNRSHTEQVIEKFCDRMELLEEAQNRSFALTVVLAEHIGHEREQILERVEAITGKPVSPDIWRTKRT